jgi:hypothetical protein
MSFTKKGTFGKNYADNLDKNLCPTCGKVVAQKNDDRTLKSHQICQCSISNKKTEINCETELDEKYKN